MCHTSTPFPTITVDAIVTRVVAVRPLAAPSSGAPLVG